MPLYHTMGIHALTGMAAVNGCFVCQPEWSAAQALRLIQAERITALYLIPTLFYDLVHAPAYTREAVESVTKLAYAGAPMLATLTDAPFDDPNWIFEDKFDGFRMVSEIRGGRVALYSRNGKIISHSYVEVAEALEGVKADAVIDGELVAIGMDGVCVNLPTDSHLPEAVAFAGEVLSKAFS